MDRYYHPSGEFSARAFIVFPLVSLILLPILGFIYAYLGMFLKGPALAFIAFVLYILVLAYSVQFVVKWGKVRNQTLARIIGIIFGLLAFYFYWVFLIFLISRQNELMVLNLSSLDFRSLFPAHLFTLTQEINQFQTLISFPYLILKGILIVLSSRQAAQTASMEPFSEVNGVWFKEKKILVSFIENKDKFVSCLEAGNDEVLDDLEREYGKSESHAVLKLYYTDHGEFYLKAKNKIARQGQKNEIRFKRDRFLKNPISIHSSSGQRLLSFSN